ncbi:MAG: TVP38/TMEM64 family protein [Clostridia bacterium]|nr:TVP38/TMEM64 family protein [Clostridia bacterium]
MEKNMKQNWLLLLLFFLLTAVCIVFAILCIHYADVAFLQTYKELIIGAAVALLYALCFVSAWLTIKGKDTLVKSLLSGYILLAFVLVLVFIFEKTGFFEVVGSSENLQAYLEKAGAWMPIVYIVLQFLQVVILPIPSVVSTVAGVTLFGPGKTILFSLLGIIPASIVAFMVGRKLGNKAVAWIVGEDTLTKWQNKLKGKDNLLLTMMFLLPMFPDDVLCFIAGLSSMSTKYFMTVITVSRVLIVTATCYSFDLIPINTWWGFLLWVLIVLVIGGVFLYLYKNLEMVQGKVRAWLQKWKKK